VRAGVELRGPGVRIRFLDRSIGRCVLVCRALDDLRFLASGLMEFMITIPWHMDGFEYPLEFIRSLNLALIHHRTLNVLRA
jgi:hypothetical protein